RLDAPAGHRARSRHAGTRPGARRLRSARLMTVSGGYVVKETAINLRRNLLMTIASMLVVVISLGLTGAALITRQAVNKQTARWKGGVELSIFMKPDASQSQVDAVRAQLDGMPGVKRYKFVDKPAAFSEMKDL